MRKRKKLSIRDEKEETKNSRQKKGTRKERARRNQAKTKFQGEATKRLITEEKKKIKMRRTSQKRACAGRGKWGKSMFLLRGTRKCRMRERKQQHGLKDKGMIERKKASSAKDLGSKKKKDNRRLGRVPRTFEGG